jgi:hypothetical protein
MTRILVTLLIGAAAGAADVAPMILREADLLIALSVFVHWVAVTIFISYMRTPLAAPIQGAVVALLAALPTLIRYSRDQPDSIVAIALMTLLLGVAAGFLTDRFAE